MSLNNKFYITNGITTDGFGARLSRALHAMAYVHYFRDKYGVDVEYAHTPFWYEGFGMDFNQGMANREAGDNEHPYNEITRDGYIKRATLWENRLEYRGVKVTHLNYNKYIPVRQIYSSDEMLLDDMKGSINSKIYLFEYPTMVKNFNLSCIEKYGNELREYFHFEKSTSNEIIIHIRRKDAQKIGSYLFVDDDYYLDILKALLPYREKYRVVIHTQRKNFDYQKYEGWDIIYDDEIEDFNAFVSLVNAKVLILGKSSFSFSAGVLNPNIVVYPPTPNVVFNNWMDGEQFKNYVDIIL